MNGRAHARKRVFRTADLNHGTVCSKVFFFFQAEDGIRDWSVTGVQTCALPISVKCRMMMRTALVCEYELVIPQGASSSDISLERSAASVTGNPWDDRRSRLAARETPDLCLSARGRHLPGRRALEQLRTELMQTGWAPCPYARR